MIRRLPDWETRLCRYIDDSERGEFRWGERDCMLWAAGAVAAVCGENPADGFRGLYADAAGASRALTERGWSTLLDAAASVVGAKPITPLRAHRGDLVWVPPGHITSAEYTMGVLGVVWGGVVAPAASRLVAMPVVPLARRGAMALPIGAR